MALLGIARDPQTPEEARLDALTVIQHMRADLDMAEYAALDAGRKASSWTALGRALGITRQGAERRWLRLAPKGTPSRDAEAGRRARQRS
ncbi:hypothetical protein BQ8420_10555 [Nocardiopsis sp. JB363]|nr:hypothetical protein BQ8420_10555 [Nocardiopsis sp. JB363]